MQMLQAKDGGDEGRTKKELDLTEKPSIFSQAKVGEPHQRFWARAASSFAG
jgi:hypothetical protein